MSHATPSPATADTPERADIERLQPLRRAEWLLLHALRSGEIARVGLRRPVMPSADITVRGELLGLLARGRLGARTLPHGVQLVGAWIEGRVDLRDAQVPEGLWFYRCVFDATPRLEGARIGASLSFSDCLLPGLRAQGCSVAEDLVLNSGCTVRTEVRLAHATIGRDLNCEGLRLRSSERSEAPARQRLAADGARIHGDVILAGGFVADGDVRLVGARIAGDLRADNARMAGRLDGEGLRSDALNLDRVRVAGRVRLDRGFSAAGPVRLAGARIEGDLDCTDADFDAYGEAGFSGHAALRLDRATVCGALVLARLRNPLTAASLLGARVGSLLDDASSWGERLALDGFAYARFAEGAPVHAAFRLNWLAQQEPSHLNADFRPGPWRQLIAVLHRMGRVHDARRVAIERESLLRRIGRIGDGATPVVRAVLRAGHALFGMLAGYGHRPARLLAAGVALWLGCAALYGAAAQQSVIAPSDSAVHAGSRFTACRAAPIGEAVNWTGCPELAGEYPAFSALTYSLDVLVPLVDLQQQNRWVAREPVDAFGKATSTSAAWPMAVHALVWLEALFGWVAALLWVAALGGWFDRDRTARAG